MNRKQAETLKYVKKDKLTIKVSSLFTSKMEFKKRFFIKNRLHGIGIIADQCILIFLNLSINR